MLQSSQSRLWWLWFWSCWRRHNRNTSRCFYFTLEYNNRKERLYSVSLTIFIKLTVFWKIDARAKMDMLWFVPHLTTTSLLQVSTVFNQSVMSIKCQANKLSHNLQCRQLLDQVLCRLVEMVTSFLLLEVFQILTFQSMISKLKHLLRHHQQNYHSSKVNFVQLHSTPEVVKNFASYLTPKFIFTLWSMLLCKEKQPNVKMKRKLHLNWKRASDTTLMSLQQVK